MYYNKILGRFIYDQIDCFLISMFISIYVTEYLKFYFSEKQKLKRLRQDLINKSKLIKDDSITTAYPSPTKAQKIFNFSIRGGSEELLYKNAQKIELWGTYLLGLVRKKINNDKIFNIVLLLIRLYFRCILRICRIRIEYLLDPLTNEFKVVTMVAGGTTGFIISWIGVGSILVAHFLGLVFLGRNFAQQLTHIKKFNKLRNEVVKLIKDKEVQKAIYNIAEQMENTKAKLKPLNWEPNPALKKAAENLGIFENPSKGGPIKSTTNSLYNRYLNKMKKAVRKVGSIEENSNSIDADFISEKQLINIPYIRIRD